ncbi:MAG: thioesterase family protein [Acidobacteriota bacterium]
MDSLDEVLERGYSESRVRVRYAETDQMGVVYHANYLVWFEIGRVDFIRHAGLDYRAMEQEEGAMIAVVEATARYKAPARYDDELIVRTSLAGVRGPIVRFRYAIMRAATESEAEVLLCEGETVHIVVGRDMKKRDMPEKYAERFAQLVHRIAKKD